MQFKSHKNLFLYIYSSFMNKTFRYISLLAVMISLVIVVSGNKQTSAPIISAADHWADSVLQTLSPDERLAQLFMVAAYSNKSLAEQASLTELIKKYNIGGLIFFQGGPLTQAKYTNYWQSIAKTPLLVAIDGEWGLGMRLKDSTLSFPKQITLGAISNNHLIYTMGNEIARQCSLLGIHMNFAPVADVNSNPHNPVINYRSFGEDPVNVAEKALAYMKGMQDHHLLACAKHFPGHGDTDQDSHHTLPVINHTLSTIDSIHLYPFKILIQNGIASVMVAHLFVPELDKTNNQPTTLSSKVITELLKNKLGFNGLIVTDALGMKGVTQTSEPGETELKAFIAGNDILLMPENLPLAFSKIKEALKNGIIKQQDIDSRCKKVLKYKYNAALNNIKPISCDTLYQSLNNIHAQSLIQQLFEASVTLVKNSSSILPYKFTEHDKVACVSLHCNGTDHFAETVANYIQSGHFQYPTFTSTDLDGLELELDEYNTVLLTVHALSNNRGTNNYGLSDAVVQLIGRISPHKKVILNLLANPYALSAIKDTSGIEAILVGYQNDVQAQKATAQAIFGGIALSGKLPVGVSSLFPLNSGIQLPKVRLGYTLPEAAGLNSLMLSKIDSIAMQGIADTVFPGCQILIACAGKVVYHKSFGWHTYEKTLPVINSDLYDLASITKIAATTLSVMKMYEEGLIDVDDKLVKYLPALDSSNKADIIIKNLMAHQARLWPWLPFYKKTMINGQPDTNIYKKVADEEFSVRVADSMYISKYYQDTIFQAIITSSLRSSSSYRYSDLGFYLLKDIIEKQTNQSINRYVRDHFYKPLGLMTLCYEPRKYFKLNSIIPSEIDTSFRMKLLHGDVNDPGAAMRGGIDGHAGLFSNSQDVAILMQMLLQEGSYGGIAYLKPETIKKFTSYQFKNNRRGLGFDKPDKNQNGIPACSEASEESYGHSGFTGTFVWVDPKYHLIYVFLSNRTYPYSAVNKLLDSGIRTQIQKIIYQSME